MPYSLPTQFPLSEWEATKITLHLFLQIIGKIRLQLHPKRNHWWHVTFFLTPSGLTTGAIPFADKLFAIHFDFLSHQLLIETNQNEHKKISLENLSVSDF
ncbi:MAG: DUF5996 family protein, partial [Pseudomonadota bacterium]